MSDVEKTRKIEQAYNDEKPWGSYEVLLDAEDCKVKRLTVKPGQRLSLQSHMWRQEHWFIVRGIAVVTVGPAEVPNDRLEQKARKTGEFIDIPRGYKHRIANIGTEPLTFIEVQTGSYFGEDDNTRHEDDYDRPSPQREASGEGS